MSERTTIGGLIEAGYLEFGDGYRTKRSELSAEGFRIIRAADVADGSVRLESPDFVDASFARVIGKKAARSGDIVLTTKGTVGRVSMMPDTDEQVVYSPQLCYFRVLDDGAVSRRYLASWFKGREFWNQASHLMTNTDMAPYLNMADIKGLRITLPGIGEQRAIAEVLGALDDKIAANTKLAATARELALAMVPVAGDRAPVRELATLQKAQIDPGTLGDEAVDHYSLPAFDSRNGPEVVKATSIKSSKFVVSEPSVLISKLNPRFPRVWDLARLNGRRALASTEFLVLEPRGISTSVLWSLLAQPSFGRALESKVAGTSGSHQRVKPIEVLLAGVSDPRGWPDESRASIESLSSAALAADAENRTLAAIRDALLPQLMSGGLRVRDFERVADGT